MRVMVNDGISDYVWHIYRALRSCRRRCDRTYMGKCNENSYLCIKKPSNLQSVLAKCFSVYYKSLNAFGKG